MKIPGREITALAWEGRSLRIAMAVDSFIYFANIRSDYMWSYFGKTVAFVQADVAREGSMITFWDTVSNQCFIKQVDNALGISSTTEHCVIAVECIRQPEDKLDPTAADSEKFQLLVCNTMSTTVDAKYTDLRPLFLAMNNSYVVIASKDQFLLWQYHTPKGIAAVHLAKQKREKRFHVDDSPSGVVEVLNDLDRNGFELPVDDAPTSDPICCLAISEAVLLIGRESGLIQEYTVPHVALCNRYQQSSRVSKIAINCNSTRAAIIDANGCLSTIDLTRRDSVGTASSAGRGDGESIERKDVWAVCWARDNPQLLAIMEKTRMYVFRGSDPEEPISCSGYICDFDDLEITAVLLDDLVSGVATPNLSEHFLQLRVKSLRDTEELLAHVGIGEAKLFIEDNAHPRLWRLLAEASLKQLDLETAETAFVRSNNYPGVQLIKRLKAIQSEPLQKAEIAAFYGDFDDAEKLYMEADRRDLAITLRHTLSDWFRMVTLYRLGSGISDQEMEAAWVEIGNHFASQRIWDSAKEYYEKAHYIEGLMEALYYMEDYEGLEVCIGRVPEGSPLLARLGSMLASVGLCEVAVKAYIRLGDVKEAVNCCVNLRQWGLAVELAQKFKMPQIGGLLGKHAAQLLQDGRLHEAVELQRKAGRYLDSARLLMKLAEGEIEKRSGYLVVKKITILAGLLTEEHINGLCSGMGVSRQTIISDLSPEDSLLIAQIWHVAEAYHFILLGQRQLKAGLGHCAMLTALRLREYEDVLNLEVIYNFLALASCADRAFGKKSVTNRSEDDCYLILNLLQEPHRKLLSNWNRSNRSASRSEWSTRIWQWLSSRSTILWIIEWSAWTALHARHWYRTGALLVRIVARRFRLASPLDDHWLIQQTLGYVRPAITYPVRWKSCPVKRVPSAITRLCKRRPNSKCSSRNKSLYYSSQSLSLSASSSDSLELSESTVSRLSISLRILWTWSTSMAAFLLLLLAMNRSFSVCRFLWTVLILFRNFSFSAFSLSTRLWVSLACCLDFSRLFFTACKRKGTHRIRITRTLPETFDLSPHCSVPSSLCTPPTPRSIASCWTPC